MISHEPQTRHLPGRPYRLPFRIPIRAKEEIQELAGRIAHTDLSVRHRSHFGHTTRRQLVGVPGSGRSSRNGLTFSNPRRKRSECQAWCGFELCLIMFCERLVPSPIASMVEAHEHAAFGEPWWDRKKWRSKRHCKSIASDNILTTVSHANAADWFSGWTAGGQHRTGSAAG